jgi:hypothetical protein
VAPSHCLDFKAGLLSSGLLATISNDGDQDISADVSFTGILDYTDGGGPQSIPVTLTKTPDGNLDVTASDVIFQTAGTNNTGMLTIRETEPDRGDGTGGPTETEPPQALPFYVSGPQPGAGANIDVNQNEPFTRTVATFRDDDPNVTPADFTQGSTINWGDGTVELVGPNDVTGSFGQFAVEGTHTYATAGHYTITVHIVDEGGSSTDVVGTAVVRAAPDRPLTPGAGANINVNENDTFTGVVATFSDSDPKGFAAQFTQGTTIDWGDGTVTPAGFIAGNPDQFTVEGTHTYTTGGDYTVTVHVVDEGGSTTDVIGMATVTLPAGVGIAMTRPVHAIEGIPYTADLLTLTNPNSSVRATDLTATINWGDATASPGTLVAEGTGFGVRGSHVYAEEGAYQVSVTIRDMHGNQIVGKLPAAVADAPLTVTGATFQAFTVTPVSGVVGVFTDANPWAQATDFRATIAWGDGLTSAATLVPLGNGRFEVRGSHTYSLAGRFAVAITVDDAGGSRAAAGGQAIVHDLPGSRVGISRGPLKRRGRRYLQRVTLTNYGDEAVAGPISLVVDGLGRRARLLNATGYTRAGSPYLNVPGPLAPDAAVSLVLQFFSPTGPVRYGTHVVVGPGPR